MQTMGLVPAKGEMEGVEGRRKGRRRTERAKGRNGGRREKEEGGRVGRKGGMERGVEGEVKQQWPAQNKAAPSRSHTAMSGVLISWLFGETLQAYSPVSNVSGLTSL